MNKQFEVFLFIIIMALSSTILYYHYPIFGIGDEIGYEVFVKNMNNNNFLKYDWYFNKELSDKINYRTIMTVIYALFLNSLNELGLYLLYFINVLLLYLGVYLVSKEVWKNNKTALLTVMLLHFTTLFHEKSIWVYGLTATGPTSIIKVLLLFSILFLFKRKYIISIILTLIAIPIHLAMGINFLIILMIYFTFLFINKKIFWNDIKRMILFLLPLSFILILLFLPLLNNTISKKNSISSTEYISILGKFWSGINIHVHWDKYIWMTFLTMIFTFILFYKKTGDYIIDYFFLISFILFWLFFVIFYIFTELYPSTIISHFHFYRLMIFVSLYMCIYLANIMRVFIEKDKNYIFLFSSYLFILFMSGIRTSLLSLAIITSIILVLFLKQKNKKQSIYSMNLFILFNTTILPIVHYLSIFLFIFLSIKIIFNTKIRLKALIIIIILLIVQIIYFINIDSKFKNTLLDKNNLYYFIQDNVPDNVEVLIPPELIDFRLKTGKVAFVDNKFIPYNANALKEYYERYNMIFNQVINYGELNEVMINKIKDKYNVKYAVFKKPKNLNYTVLFENKEYVLYKL